MARSADRTYYEILGVPTTATTAEIKAAYRQLVSQVHPDHGGSAALFQLVADAYQTLVDPLKRKKYDESLRSPQTSEADPGQGWRDADEAQGEADAKESGMSGSRRPSSPSGKFFTSRSHEVVTSYPAGSLLVTGIVLSCFVAPLQNLGLFCVLLGLFAVIGKAAIAHQKQKTSGTYTEEMVTGLALLRREILVGIPVSVSAVGKVLHKASDLLAIILPRRASDH